MNSIRCHPPCSGVENKTWIELGLGRPRQDKQDASRFGSRRCLRPHEPKTRRVNRVIPSSRATTSLERRVKKLPGNTPDPAYSQRVLDYSQELRGTQAHTVPSSSQAQHTTRVYERQFGIKMGAVRCGGPRIISWAYDVESNCVHRPQD